MPIHPTEYGSSVLCIGAKTPDPSTPRPLPRPTPSRWGRRVRLFVGKDVYAFFTLEVLFQTASTLIQKNKYIKKRQVKYKYRLLLSLSNVQSL